MSGAEAVRKEFEAVADEILDSAYDSLISHGQRKAAIMVKLQASRSAAIQECADAIMHERPVFGTELRDIVLALKER